MQIVSIIDSSVHRQALKAARAMEQLRGIEPGALYAALPDEGQTWAAIVWGKVEHILQLAWDEGKAAAGAAIDALTVELGKMKAELGRGARAVQDAVAAQVALYVRKVVDGALSRVQRSVTVGDQELPIQAITVQQTLRLSGSLKVSLEGVCEFLSEGQLSLTANYAIPAPPPYALQPPARPGDPVSGATPS